MYFIYNIIVKLAGSIIWVSSKFSPKLNKFRKGRINLFDKIEHLSIKDQNPIWFHCSSLGEFEQGRPLIEKIKQKHPDNKILLTFFSPSGYEVQKKYKHADWVFYLPLDTESNMQKFIEITNPKMVFLIKYEFWINLITELHRNSIPIYSISSIFNEKQVFFSFYGGFFRRILKKIDFFFVQDENSKNLLNSIKINGVEVIGDSRFDRVLDISKREINLDFVQRFKQNDILVVFGSTWQNDEDLIVRFINKNSFTNVKYLIAPHNIVDSKIEKLQNSIDDKSILYTSIKSDLSLMKNEKIMILNSVGILSKVYKYADISYVGGGFTKDGIHNCLEPAVFGSAVFFGKNYDKFIEAIGLVQCDGAISINDFDSFENVLNIFVKNTEKRQKTGLNATKFIKKHSGSTDKIIEKLFL